MKRPPVIEQVEAVLKEKTVGSHLERKLALATICYDHFISSGRRYIWIKPEYTKSDEHELVLFMGRKPVNKDKDGKHIAANPMLLESFTQMFDFHKHYNGRLAPKTRHPKQKIAHDVPVPPTEWIPGMVSGTPRIPVAAVPAMPIPVRRRPGPDPEMMTRLDKHTTIEQLTEDLITLLKVTDMDTIAVWGVMYSEMIMKLASPDIHTLAKIMKARISEDPSVTFSLMKNLFSTV